MTYDNTDRGALFKNDRKESDKHPDYKGTINIGGRDYDLAAWISKSKAGQTYMSLKASEPRARSEGGGVPSEPGPAGGDDLDSEIPF